MNIKNIKKIAIYILDCLNNHRYDSTYLSWMKGQGIPNKPVKGEDEWYKKWNVLGIKPNRLYYRLYSHYIGPNINIVPKNVCHNIIELILNPFRYVGYYGDKNLFDCVLPHGTYPLTLLRRMQGFYYDAAYHRVKINEDALEAMLSTANAERIVLKPTVVTMGGVGVRIFHKEGSKWKDVKTGETLNLNLLEKNGCEDFIVQEALSQHEFMNQFNPTSVNTIRLSVYKSVVDDTCHVTQAVIRIGRQGSVVDNGSAGGMFVGINKCNGKLQNRVYSEIGEVCTDFNGIDFTQSYQVPHWNDIVVFAKQVCNCVPCQRLFALDVVLCSDGRPRLLEFNLTGYSDWLFQYSIGPAFGEYTDEIIEYCKTRLAKRERVLYL